MIFKNLFHKPPTPIPYDPSLKTPILKCSICTGEQVAGFKDLHTGKLEEAMLIRSQKDLDSFMVLYGLTEVRKEY